MIFQKKKTLRDCRILHSSKSVMMKPVTLGCGHSGCLICLTSLLRYHEQKGNNTAPCHMCHSAFDNTALSVNVTLDSTTSELQVRCTNNGCWWSGKFSSVERHDQECPHLVLNCPSCRCDKMMKPIEVASHLHTCGKYAVKCPDCEKDVERDDLARHSETGCLYSTIRCPLGCGKQLLWYVVYCLFKLKCISQTVYRPQPTHFARNTSRQGTCIHYGDESLHEILTLK